MIKTHNLSPSPSKKIKEIKQIPSLPQFFKSLPISIPEQIATTVNELFTINETFKNHLSTLTAYRVNLGSEIQKSWIQMLNFSRKLIFQIDTISKKKQKQHEDNIMFVSKERERMEDQIRALRSQLNTMTSLKDVQQSQAQQAMVEVETLRKEISQIHRIVQKDMNKVMEYLIVLQKSERSDVSNQIFSCLERLALSLNRLEDESNTSKTVLGTMEQVIKAMTKNNKTDAFTQLDENQLESRAEMIFPSKRQKIDIYKLETSSINFSKQLDRQTKNKHVMDQLRIKEHDFPPQAVSKKNPDRSWVLPPSIVLFLENMAKQNENGKVLPWQYVKKIIYEVYSQRITHKKEIIAGLVGSSIPMDEFIVMLFIRKYNMRRLAELKLLQFLISIKYYTKFWLKAETFSAVLDIMRINPSFQMSDTNVYKFDIYVQHYFFHLLGNFDKNDLSEQEDGATFIQFETLKLKIKSSLFFCQQLNKSRLFSKLQKTIRSQQNEQYVDFDLAISLCVEEFFFARKTHLANIGKSFSKVHQLCEGYFSIKQMATIFNEFQPNYIKGQEKFGCKYPSSSGLQLCKLYLYSITSAKNGFIINSKEFLVACQRFGFDCPVPFLHQCNPTIKRKSRLEKSVSLSPRKTFSQQFVSNASQFNEIPFRSSLTNSPERHRVQNLPIQHKQNQQNPYNKRVEIGTYMFSQHFTVLRQLQQYCKVFRDHLSKQTDLYILWAQFDSILRVLEKGCLFLKYPLKH